MPPKAVITRITQSSNIGPKGQLTPTYIVQFSVGDHGPFTITVTQDDFKVATVQQRLADFAAAIGTLTTAN